MTSLPERAIRFVDRGQQRYRVLGFAFAINKKFSDDRGTQLVALLAYYGFMALFPAMLLLATILGYIGNERISKNVLGDTLRQFPVLGDQIGRQAAHPITGNALALVVGIVGLVYGMLGVAQIAQHAMAQVWNVPGVDRPGYLPRLARGLLFFVILAISVVGGSALSGLITLAGRALWARLALLLASVATSVVTYIAVFRVLTPKEVATRKLIPGAILGGVAWTILLTAGTALVQHQLRHAQALYGTFGLVLGLLAWLYLAAEIALYGAEINVVLFRHLWPRSIVQPPLTEADEEVLGAIALQEERRPEQEVHVEFRSEESAADREPPG